MNEPDDFEPEYEAMAEPAKVQTDGITIEVKRYALDAIANAAAAQIATTLSDTVAKMIDDRLDVIMNDAWCAAVEARAREVIDTFLDKPRHPTNQWGETLHGRPAMTLAERIPETVNAWLMERVNEKGARFDGYNSRDKGAARVDWMIAQLVTANLKDETEKAAKQVTEKARAVVAQHVGRFVAEQMAPAIDVQRVNS
jgi:uncharacterized protein (DUF1778 family)